MELILKMLRSGKALVNINGCRGECRWDGLNCRWFCHLYDGENNYDGYGRSRGRAVGVAEKAFAKQFVTA